MLVSIILCTYNRAALLPRAIRSALRQSYKKFELIVVDDGSTDATPVIIQDFHRKDSRIVSLYQRNTGLAGARNAGLAFSKGDLVCFLDSDDELAPAHLERRVKYLIKNPSVDFLHGGAKLIGPRSKHYVVDLTDRSKLIHLRHCHIGGTFFFRRKVLKRVKKFKSIPFGEDFDFCRRVERNFIVHKVRFATYVYHLEAEDRLCDVYTEQLMKVENGKAE